MTAIDSVSALASVYFKESPGALAQCLASIASGVGALNVEVVLVQDGPIGLELRKVIDSFRNSLCIKDVILQRNEGLGPALSAGLVRCSNELVARFDTDDVYPPDRLAMQIREFALRPRLAVLGGCIDEFDTKPELPVASRRVPVGPDMVSAYARRRCPLNHMTVMFRKSVVLEAGNYGSEHLFEDYALWVRVLQLGYEIDNLPQVLAHARVGNGMYRRRGGWRYARSEISLLYEFWHSEFISTQQFVTSVITRAPVRLMPSWAREWVYQKILRSRRS